MDDRCRAPLYAAAPASHVSIYPAYGLVAVSLLALVRAKTLPPVRPVALALGALALLDATKFYAQPWRAVDATLFMLWPLSAATLAAWAWRSRPRLTAASFALYPAMALLPRWPWATHPRAWAVAQWAPSVAGLLVAGVAWWRWKDEGPGAANAEPSSAPESRGTARLTPIPSRALAQQVAGILALSSAVDLLVGAGAPGIGYEYAAPLAWATWAALGWVLVRHRTEA